MRRISLFFLMFCCFNTSDARKILVVDSLLKLPIADAYIENGRGDIISFTNDQGMVTLSNNYSYSEITIKHVAYKSCKVDLKLYKRDTVLMVTKAHELEGVEVVKNYSVLRKMTIKGSKANRKIDYLMTLHFSRNLFSVVDIDTGIHKYRIKSIKPHFSFYENSRHNKAKVSVTLYEYTPIDSDTLPELIPVSETITLTHEVFRKNPDYKINSKIINNRSGKVLVQFRTILPENYASGGHFVYLQMNMHTKGQKTIVVDERKNGLILKFNEEMIMDMEIEEIE